MKQTLVILLIAAVAALILTWLLVSLVFTILKISLFVIILAALLYGAHKAGFFLNRSKPDVEIRSGGHE